MSAKSRLVKIIIIDIFIILLTYINLIPIYLTLFLNKKQLFFSITGLLIMLTITFLYPTSFLASLLLLSLNLINLYLL